MTYGHVVLHPDPLVREKASQYLQGLPALRRFNPDQERDDKGRFAPGGGDDEGSGGGIRESLAQAETTAEVERIASAEAARISGREVPFEFGATDPEIAREHAEGVLRGMERFPGAPLERVGLSDVEGEFAHATLTPNGGMAIEFSSKYASMSPDDYRAKIEENSGRAPRIGERAVFKEPMHVAIHEYGHVVSTGRGQDLKNRDIAGAFVERERPGADDSSYRSVVSSEISIFATSNPMELSAEAFADVTINGDSASPLSQEIYANLQQAYGN